MANPTNGCDESNLNGNMADAVLPANSAASVKYIAISAKKENDKKEYRVIKLTNGFKALLIATPDSAARIKEASRKTPESDNNNETGKSSDYNETDSDKNDNFEPKFKRVKAEESTTITKEVNGKMAACGLAINVGTFNDPREFPGMAHFLQRMIVVDSANDSQQCDFEDMIKRYGGSVEAHTEYDQTKFKFVVPSEYLRVALNDFSRLFMNPRLNRDIVSRVRQFVILRDNLTDERLYENLCRFRRRHYRAHNMMLTIEANLTLDSLEKYVNESFATLPDDSLPMEYFCEFSGPELLDTSGSQRIFEIKSVNGERKIELIWTIPTHYPLYRRNPLQYIAWVLCHKGKGSLLSFLRKKQWSIDIFHSIAKTRSETSTYTQFSLSLIITAEGFKYWMNVVRTVYSFISMIARDSAQQKRIYNELIKIDESKLRLSKEPRPIDLFDLYNNLCIKPANENKNGADYCTDNYLAWLKMCMDALTPENANVMIYYQTWDDTQCDKIEPWFKMKYVDTQMLKSSVRFFKNGVPSPELHLPISNSFITDDFTLVPPPTESSRYPVKIYSGKSSEIWYKHDNKSGVPECCMNFHFISPLPLSSPENAGMLDLFVAVLKQLILEELYPATAAGLKYRIDSSDKGLKVEVHGCNQKLPLLVTSITRYIAECPKLMVTMSEDFKEVMNEQRKSYHNKFSNPDQLAEDVRLSILRLVHWSTIDKHEALFRVNARQFDHFVKHFDDRIYIQCLVQGNMRKEDAIKTVQKCVEMLHCGPLLPLRPRMRATEIPLGVTYCRVKSFDTNDSYSVAMNYYQFENNSIRWAVIIELLNMIVNRNHFDGLETRNGFDGSKYRLVADTSCSLGYTIMRRSSLSRTELIDENIEEFRKIFAEILNAMTENELSAIKETLTKIKRERTMSLKDEVKKNWAEITSGMYIFDRLKCERDAIREITLEDLRKLMIIRNADTGNFRKLSVQIRGENIDDVARVSQGSSVRSYNGKDKYTLQYLNNPEREENGNDERYITDIEEFKCSLNVLRLQNSIS